MKTFTPLVLQSLPLAVGATTPSAPTGALAWSTALAEVLSYNGSSWQPSVTGRTSSVGTPFSVPILTSSTVVHAANTARLGISFTNLLTSSGTVYVACGYTPTTVLYDVALVPGAYYEVPFSFTGAINAIAAANGSTLVGSE